MASYKEQKSAERFEKRKIPRFPVQLPAHLGHDENDLSSICTNLSSNGVSVETAKDIGVGERLAVKVVISPKDEPLRMLGQIVWRRAIDAMDTNANPVHELGIRFVRPLPNSWKPSNESEFHSEQQGPDMLDQML